MRPSLFCVLLMTGFAAAARGETGCPRVYPASVHLFLPASLPPGPYPYVEDAAEVWVECDNAPAGGVPIDVRVTGSAPVDLEWAVQTVYRPADTTWQNMKVRAMSRAITPVLGTRQAQIEITAAGQTVILPVEVTTTDAVFAKPELATFYMGFLSPSLIDIGRAGIWFPNAQSPVSFAVTTDSPGWLSTSPAGGYGYTRIEPVADTSLLPGGESFGAVIVNAPDAVNSPLRIPVRVLNLTGSLWATPGSLNFTGWTGESAPPPQTIEITNLNPGSAAFQVASDAAWLSVSPSNGTTPGRITVSVDITGLQIGTYRGNVTVRAANAPSLPVSVVLTVAAPNRLTLSAGSFSFYTWPGRTVMLSDEGHLLVTSTRPLSFTVDSPAWIYHSPWNITPADVHLSPKWELLNPGGPIPTGTFTGVITVSSADAGNSPQQATVTAYSLAAAPLNTSPNQVTFRGTNPPPQTVQVTAPNPTPFVVSVPADATWLAVAPASATTPAILTLSVTSPGLPATGGTAMLTLYVNQSDGAQIPVRVPVWF